MSEVLLTPATVTGIAVTIQLANLHSGRVTRSAFERIVIPVQGESSRCMRKSGLPFDIVTVPTISLEMTIGADLVLLFFSLHQVFRVGKVMAVATVFILVTVNALESKEIDMLIVIERYDWTRLIRSVVDLGGRRSDDWM